MLIKCQMGCPLKLNWARKKDVPEEKKGWGVVKWGKHVTVGKVQKGKKKKNIPMGGDGDKWRGFGNLGGYLCCGGRGNLKQKLDLEEPCVGKNRKENDSF